MLKNNVNAITQQFMFLVKHQLDATELDIFVQLINELYQSLASGNSCLELDLTKYDLVQVICICNKTQLVAQYNGPLSEKLSALPLALWQTAGKTLLFLTRYLAYEKRIVASIMRLHYTPLDKQVQLKNVIASLKLLQTKNDLPNDEQLNAIIQSTQRKFNIITGGPGTGKTTTVTLLLWALYQLYGDNLKVKICAPTGKAAIRVKGSINSSIEQLKHSAIDTTCFNELIADATNFGTIHKLLGTISNKIYFKHDYTNVLDVDVLIIDESSMVGLPLFSKLITAVNFKQIKHVILLGDKNQLSSVEEGYVFASLVNLEVDSHDKVQQDLFDYSKIKLCSELVVSKRNNALIANLARLILAGHVRELIAALEEHNLLYKPQLQQLLNNIIDSENGLITYMQALANEVSYYKHNLKQLFERFNQQSTLCATNSGVFGTDNVNKLVEQHLKQKFAFNQEWYTGRAIMVLQNDYNLELFNGDIGICLIDNNEIRIYFENGKVLIPEVLPKYSLAFVITIHKSQGSEYQHVNVVLPSTVTTQDNSSFYSRELFYTAITRAKQSVTVFSDTMTLSSTLANPTLRSSGISLM